MATISEIAKDIKDTFGSSIINATQAGQYLGMCREKRGEFLASVPVYRTGKEKKYHALDIARRLETVRRYESYGTYSFRG